MTLLTSQNQATVTLAQQQCLLRFKGLVPESKPEGKGYVFHTHRENELYFRLHPKFAYLYENVTPGVEFLKALASLRNCNPTFNMKATWQISVGGGQINLTASSVTSVMRCGLLGKHLPRHLWKGPENFWKHPKRCHIYSDIQIYYWIYNCTCYDSCTD